MSLTNVVETDKEIFHGLLFSSNCCEVVQQLRGNIVAIGIPPLDLRFNLLPDGFTALCQCIELCATGAFRPFGFTAAFERSQSSRLALAGCAIVGGVRAQLACGAWGRCEYSILPPAQYQARFVQHMRIAFEQLHEKSRSVCLWQLLNHPRNFIGCNRRVASTLRSGGDEIAVNTEEIRKGAQRTGQRAKPVQGLQRVIRNAPILHRHQPQQIEQSQVATQNVGTQRCQRAEPA